VATTYEWADIIDLGADCFTYFGNSIGRERQAIADLVPFLERGTNVVTFSGIEIAHPASAAAELQRADRGGMPYHATGAQRRGAYLLSC